MIRRILVFLAILFVSFFAWRWFDKAAADGFLVKVKNFSFKKQPSQYTTTITDPDGNTIVLDDEGTNTIGSTGLRDILSDTLADKTASGSEVNEWLLQQILTTDTLRNTATQNTGTVINVSGLTGEVVVNTGPIETISAQPPKTITTPSQPTVVRPSQQPASSLSDQDKSELANFLENWF